MSGTPFSSARFLQRLIQLCSCKAAPATSQNLRNSSGVPTSKFLSYHKPEQCLLQELALNAESSGILLKKDPGFHFCFLNNNKF